MINIYYEGNLENRLVDVYVCPWGTIMLNHFTENHTEVLNVVLIGEDLGMTPEQIETVRKFAQLDKITLHMTIC